MAIPLEQGRLKKIAEEKRTLERQEKNTTKDVRRLLCMARIKAIESNNGVDGASDDMLALLDMAIKRGMASDAIRAGGGMVGKINALLDRPWSQAHALGLLWCAADLMAEFDEAKASTLRTMAEGLDNTTDVGTWRDIATPRVEIMRQ